MRRKTSPPLIHKRRICNVGFINKNSVGRYGGSVIMALHQSNWRLPEVSDDNIDVQERSGTYTVDWQTMQRNMSKSALSSVQ
ncbi:unnamed protein product [Litomosoides sigmodontis]|uniref:Uncharacterized protein n=1 Tax=Litomosoides sigmodontis TaxID=42156 RepID=A0A3P6UMD1_LITSI|nr:unnamed protein product [Litomosoides sigmodontis]